jgi:outer membrane biosynthesis protein TonB
VTVAVSVDVEGKVTRARATSGPESLRGAAAAAAYKARFVPTKLGGVPVIVEGVLTYNFKR